MHLEPSPRWIEFGLQPTLIIGVVASWFMYRDAPMYYPIAIVSVQIILGFFEYLYPARPIWTQRAKEKFYNVVMVFILYSLAVAVAGLYSQWLMGPLADIRTTLGIDVWPHHWPIVAQLILVFFSSELLWYWMHRAEHRWTLIWKASGHGTHHSFKSLTAINFGLNHPLEAFFLVLPALIVELLFGVGIAAAGAGVLTAVLASIAHTNVKLNSKWIGALLTTNEYHIRHHSIVLAESNTNYGCSAIIWDRVFGTFASGHTLEAGIGPTEPTLWEKIMLPFREPADSAIAPMLNPNTEPTER